MLKTTLHTTTMYEFIKIRKGCLKAQITVLSKYKVSAESNIDNIFLIINTSRKKKIIIHAI